MLSSTYCLTSHSHAPLVIFLRDFLPDSSDQHDWHTTVFRFDQRQNELVQQLTNARSQHPRSPISCRPDVTIKLLERLTQESQEHHQRINSSHFISKCHGLSHHSAQQCLALFICSPTHKSRIAPEWDMARWKQSSQNTPRRADCQTICTLLSNRASQEQTREATEATEFLLSFYWVSTEFLRSESWVVLSREAWFPLFSMYKDSKFRRALLGKAGAGSSSFEHIWTSLNIF